MIRIAMVEDDKELAALLGDFLAKYEMEVSNYETPKAFINALDTTRFDFAIVDLTLPQMDGLELCKIIEERFSLPFIISSARSDVADKLIGLERGADDYLPKPYDPRELVARIQTVLRRNKHPMFVPKNSRLVIDDRKMCAYLDGVALDLTTAEFEILQLLAEKDGSVLTRDYIAENVGSMKWESGERSIDVVVSRLRKKLGDSSKSPEFIKAVKGIGYKYIG